MTRTEKIKQIKAEIKRLEDLCKLLFDLNAVKSVEKKIQELTLKENTRTYIGDIMTKLTYTQLLSLVQYLAVHANYENLPLPDELKSAIQFCLEDSMINAFDFNEEETLESVVSDIVELLDAYAYDFDDDQRDRISESLSENTPI